MARLQLLPLPATPDDPTPFAVIIDQLDQQTAANLDTKHIRDWLGARAVLTFPFSLDVAGQTSGPVPPEILLRPQPSLSTLRRDAR